MKRYRYSYQSFDRYDNLVTFCQFLMRCTPYDNESQRLSERNFYVLNATSIHEDCDCFGNTIHYGVFKPSHDLFVVSTTGVVECVDRYGFEDSEPHPLFGAPTPLTKMDCAMLQFYASLEVQDGELDGQVSDLSSSVHEYMEYVKGVTGVATSAAESFAQAKGVCQDYSHILIALCRERGIMARYVAGFVLGEGESHAWVEYWDHGVWRGVDPTHNRLIEDGYIKVAHGRDASDCSIIRGMRRGVTNHTSQIRVIVEQI
ncbi:MAG: transglutaminase family protein [Rikenellaceae bacterium]